MVMVRVSETYDLSTKVGKMGIVGIHTPKSNIIKKMWSGLISNFKFGRFVGCDVQLACASMLPADPLQIGVDAGSIAPQDMFNPILYKAVSNDSMSNLQAWLMSKMGGNASAIQKGSIIDVNSADFQFDDAVSISQFDMYYALLADTDGWKKAMPQAGLSMTGLYPIVYALASNVGANDINGGLSTQMSAPKDKDATGSGSTNVVGVQYLRGPAMRMPRVNTVYFHDTSSVNQDDKIVDQAYTNFGANTAGLPMCYVGMIVLPPAKLNQLYYRLKVTWTIEFTEVRPVTDISNWRLMSEVGSQAYGTDYNVQSKVMSASEAMVDVNGADIEKVMEGA